MVHFFSTLQQGMNAGGGRVLDGYVVPHTIGVYIYISIYLSGVSVYILYHMMVAASQKCHTDQSLSHFFF